MSGSDDADRFGPLDAALATALAPVRQEPGPIILLFSGGIDSAFLAHALADTGRLRLWTIGIADSPEAEVAQSAAEALGLPWGFGTIDSGEVARAVERWGPGLRAVRGPARSVAIALALAIASAPPGRIVTGQGADELFLGYAHFRGIDAEAVVARSRADFERLDHQDGPRLERIAGELGRTIGAPFTHPALRAAVEQWPIVERLPRELTKPLLREWARRRGVPEPILRRPKRAIQYGSGVDRLLRLLARARN
ncbi:MAG: asparagine synthase C-terminal domain-containing protein [Thermoplasmata archaeon]